MAFALLMLTACSQTIFHKKVIASTEVEAVPEFTTIKDIEVERCNRVILFFPFPADYKEMYEYAMADARDAGGDGLVDFQMKSSGFTFVYPLFMNDCWTASGKAVKFKSTGSNWDAPAKTESDASSSNSSEGTTQSTWDAPEAE